MSGGRLRWKDRRPVLGIFLAVFVQSCIEDPIRDPVPTPEDPQYVIWDVDTYAADRCVRIFWDATPMDEMRIPPPPNPEPRMVRVEMSTASASSGFHSVWSSPTIGPDSIEVPDLANGSRHWFRILSFDAADHLVGASRVLETIPGLPLVPTAVIPAFQRHFLSRDLAWSPRGDKLVFASAPGCVRENLSCYDVDTEQVTPVTGFGADEQRLSHAGWSPDGSNLVFDYTGSTTYYALDYRIWILAVDSNLPQSVSSGHFDAHPAWVTNTTLVFIQYTNSPQAPEIQRLVLGTEPQVSPVSSDGRIWKQDLAVSQDGSTIVYSGTVYEEGARGRCLYTLSTQGGSSRMLEVGGWWDDVHPAWHPNGRRIYFASNRSGHYEIWSVELPSSALRQITRSRRGEDRYDPAVAPEGRRLALLASRGSPSVVEIVVPAD